VIVAHSPSFPAFCWLASIAVHAFAFTAIGHAPPRARLTLAVSTDAPIDVETAMLVPKEADENAPARVATAATLVAPPTHKHSYPVPLDHDAHPHDPSLVHLPLAAAAPAATARTDPPPAAMQSAPPAAARFTMSIRDGNPTAARGDAPSRDDGDRPGSDTSPLPEATVSSSASLIGALSPEYPAAARAQGVEADTVLSLVVSAQGIVRDAQVMRPAGFGFDEAALRAVRSARFAPARRNGEPVAVRMRWTVSFRLR
jgi:TonB family protein